MTNQRKVLARAPMESRPQVAGDAASRKPKDYRSAAEQEATQLKQNMKTYRRRKSGKFNIMKFDNFSGSRLFKLVPF